MKRILAVAALATAMLLNNNTRAASPISSEEAHAIGLQAYLYFYPLVTMDVTRKQFVNVAHPDGVHAPMNVFSNMPAYPTAEMRQVVRPNFDTLYSAAWVDLTKEPMILSVPDTGGRYYLMPMLDMWTDVFASPGWRTTGTQAGNFLLAPAVWQGSIPAGVKRINAPTPYVWIIGRTKTDGPADYDGVHKIQAGYALTPLSHWGKPAEPVIGRVDPSVDMKTPPKNQVDNMPADKFFTYAAELLKVIPPHVTDEPIVAQIRRLGIQPGQDLDFSKLDPNIQKALSSAPADAQQLMKWKTPTLARIQNGWSMNTDTMGVYGNYYLKRAIVAQMGLGANVPEDAIYPLNLFDSTKQPLDGAEKYVIHFNKSDLPPVNAFWSITLYDSEGFQVSNVLNRFAVSSWMPFKYNADGSLDLYFQNENPGKDLEGNWLPTPKGPFNLTMRLYAPKPDALTGKWAPPPITKVEKLPPFLTQ